MSDVLAAASWWLIIEVLGLTVLPLAQRLFRWLPAGFLLAKPLGLLLVSYVLWLLASLGIIQNSILGIGIAWLIVLVAGMLISRLRREDTATSSQQTILREQRNLIIASEIIFALAFIGWLIVRAHMPDATSGEKPMELAFINAIGRSLTFPPIDPWLSGFSISYYYFGYVMLALLGKISGASGGLTFGLSNALWFALTFSAAWGLTANIILSVRRHAKRAAIAVGVLSALLLCIVGNYEAPLEVAHNATVGGPSFWAQLDILDLNQPANTGTARIGNFSWWWRASRIIHDYWPTTITPHLAQIMQVSPDSNSDFQELIDEFPQFSFLIGDMHPHVLDLPFVLLALGLALNLFVSAAAGEVRALWRDVPVWWLYPVVLGGLGFLNTWDFPIYAFFTVAAFSIGLLHAQQFRWRSILIDVILLGMLSIIYFLPFYRSFSSQASGISINLFNGTSAAQYFVMFGPFILIGVWGTVRLMVELIRSRQIRLSTFMLRSIGLAVGLTFVAILAAAAVFLVQCQSSNSMRGGFQNLITQMADRGITLTNQLLARLTDPWTPLLIALAFVIGFAVWRLRRSISQPAFQFVALLVLTGLLLTFVPEFAYITDVTNTRMNTVFKFYYQAWVMWSIVSAVGLFYLWEKTSVSRRLIWIAATSAIVALGLIYPALAISTHITEIAAARPTLDVIAATAQSTRDADAANVYAAAQWLNQNVAGTSIVLQTTDDVPWFEPERSRLSSWTGLPTILGWFGHETQWRGNDTLQRQRLPDIQTIYSTTDQAKALSLLKQYKVAYVYVGSIERQQYKAKALAKFAQMLPVVFQHNDVTIYQVP